MNIPPPPPPPINALVTPLFICTFAGRVVVFGGKKISGRKIKQFILYMHPENQPVCRGTNFRNIFWFLNFSAHFIFFNRKCDEFAFFQHSLVKTLLKFPQNTEKIFKIVYFGNVQFPFERVNSFPALLDTVLLLK